jgi:hypothetical protein
MFADFRVHGLTRPFSNAFTTGPTHLQEKKKEKLPPDFLWSLVALANLMRLSLLKAAHAVMSGAAYRKSGSPIVFNPCTRNSANMGHPSRGQGLVGSRDSGGQNDHQPPKTALKSFISLLARHRPPAPLAVD